MDVYIYICCDRKAILMALVGHLRSHLGGFVGAPSSKPSYRLSWGITSWKPSCSLVGSHCWGHDGVNEIDQIRLTGKGGMIEKRATRRPTGGFQGGLAKGFAIMFARGLTGGGLTYFLALFVLAQSQRLLGLVQDIAPSWPLAVASLCSPLWFPRPCSFLTRIAFPPVTFLLVSDSIPLATLASLGLGVWFA